jgi:hypothetical protein
MMKISSRISGKISTAFFVCTFAISEPSFAGIQWRLEMPGLGEQNGSCFAREGTGWQAILIQNGTSLRGAIKTYADGRVEDTPIRGTISKSRVQFSFFRVFKVTASGDNTLGLVAGSKNNIYTGIARGCGGAQGRFKMTQISHTCDFSSVSGEQKCKYAVGNQCEGGMPAFAEAYNPKYDYSTCTVDAIVSPGSYAHDKCCIANPSGYACQGWTFAEPVKSPGRNILCENEWRIARDDVLNGRGQRKIFGPYEKK